MTRRRLVLSVVLSLMFTVGLLVGLSLSDNSAVASAEDLKSIDQGHPRGATGAEGMVSTAHIVVRFADNDTIVRPITFTKPITGYTALKLAGLDLDVIDMGWGLMLCGIEGVGKSLPDDSGCDNGTRYWGTSYWNDVAWSGRMTGIDSAVISQTGHVEGFSFSDPGYAAVDPPPAPPLTGASDALDWLRNQQQADGGFGSLNGTAEVLMAVGANRVDASTWRQSPSLHANTLSNGKELATRNAAGAGKLAVGLAGQESCWPMGADYPIDYYDPVSGTFSGDTLYQAWGILGTAAMSESVPTSAVEALKDNQLLNGGWEWAAEMGADTNDTALALQALIAAGEPLTSTSVVSGLTYLKYAQNDDGGFPYSPDSPWGRESDTNSTAYVVQALLAAGEDPLGATWTVTDTNPISFLLGMQLPDGSFEYQKGGGSDQFATRQAIPALLHRPFPLMVKALESCYGVSGQMVSTIGGTETALESVTMEAEGADDLFFGTTDAAGGYTLSVPEADTYVLTPSRDGFTFTPTAQSVEVGGAPGDITPVSSFSGEARVYLPLIMRH